MGLSEKQLELLNLLPRLKSRQLEFLKRIYFPYNPEISGAEFCDELGDKELDNSLRLVKTTIEKNNNES